MCRKHVAVGGHCQNYFSSCALLADWDQTKAPGSLGGSKIPQMPDLHGNRLWSVVWHVSSGETGGKPALLNSNRITSEHFPKLRAHPEWSIEVARDSSAGAHCFLLCQVASEDLRDVPGAVGGAR